MQDIQCRDNYERTHYKRFGMKLEVKTFLNNTSKEKPKQLGQTKILSLPYI